MKFKVVTDEPQYILDWINSLYVNFENDSVKKIQTELLEMLTNPGNYRCMSKADVDKIFRPKEKPWDKGTSGGAYGYIKPTMDKIKLKMFIENPDC